MPAPISAVPNVFTNIFTIGIARAKWIVEANAAFGHTTNFLFAWLLQPFANYGLAERFNTALRSAGSAVTVPAIVVFLFAAWPFFGAPAQFRKGVAAVNSAGVGHAPAAA